MRFMKVRIAAAAAVGLVTAGMVVTPAHAAPLWCMIVTSGDGTLARGCFDSYGDKIDISDQYSDGLRAVVEWETDYGRAGECHDATGAYDGYVTCNYDMSENGYLRFKVAVRNGASGSNQHSTSWSSWHPIDGS